MKLATSAQMRELDRTTIEDIGIPGVVLMENAGRSTVEQMEHTFGPVTGKTVLIFVGPGNNGGDGLVIARHVLARHGHPMLIFLVAPEKLTADAAVNAAVCSRMHISSRVILQEDDLEMLRTDIQELHFAHPVHSLVDSLFGTGLKRPVEGRFAAAVHLINQLARTCHWPVVAVDIASGTAADTGATLGCTVRADLTVTYGLAKPAHYLNGGPSMGRVAVADISIPARVISSADLPGRVLDREIRDALMPRKKAAHKGSFGHLLILAGSEGKTGAAILCGRGGLHSGCGLVTLAVPSRLNPIFETSLPEAMTVPLACSATFFCQDDYDQILELLAGKTAMVIGPGLGMDPDTGSLVRRLYRELPLPMVVDADALNLLAVEPDCIRENNGERILTPHPGEMARLTGTPTAQIQADRLSAADWLGTDRDDSPEIITVLKGAGTVVCSSRGGWAINSSGNNGMAAGGMGDVLAGCIGGLLCQGYTSRTAAEIGVYLHGMAADMLAEHAGHGYLASEVAATLPAAAAALHAQRTA